MNLDDIFLRSGSRRRSSSTEAYPTGYIVLYGSDIHSYLLSRDVNQVVGSWLRKVFYKRLVLARLYHRNGKKQIVQYLYLFLVCKLD